MATPISADDIQAINHINYVSNSMHELTDELYEDLKMIVQSLSACI